jgi:hypothetical protein
MLGHSPAHPLAPTFKAAESQLSAHHLDHLGLGKSSPTLNFLKCGSISPSHPDDLVGLRDVQVFNFTVHWCLFRTGELDFTPLGGELVRNQMNFNSIQKEFQLSINS